MGLRHGDVGEGNKYSYYKYRDGDTASSFLLYIAQKYYEPIDEVFAFYPELHMYNEAYSRTNSLQRYLPILSDYDYCNDCLLRFPYRVMYSEADDIERRQDAFLTIYPNNYKDVDGNSGPITDMFVNFNELYINTPYCLYHIPTNPQVLTTTDNTNVFLGTGGVLPQPFRPVKNVDTPAGGSSLWKSRVSTELGTVYVDDISGRVFLLSNGLQDISANGLRAFWRDNGVLELVKQMKKLTQVDYDNLCLASDIGVGITSVYDPIHKRIIIHKRDYKLRPEYESTFVYSAEIPDGPLGSVWFDGNSFYFRRSSLGYSSLSLSDARYFENKSFTISYSLIRQA